MVTHQSGQEAAVGGQNAREKSFYRHAVGGKAGLRGGVSSMRGRWVCRGVHTHALATAAAET
jgi:hypothetical protein